LSITTATLTNFYGKIKKTNEFKIQLTFRTEKTLFFLLFLLLCFKKENIVHFIVKVLCFFFGGGGGGVWKKIIKICTHASFVIKI
jgi:hypothetical protein